MTAKRGAYLFLAVLSLYAVLHLYLRPVLFKQERISGFDDSSAGLNGGSWKAYGGSWELSKGVMRDNSYERGAKLITGSKRAEDYRIDTDVAVVGNYGDAGVVLRARDLEEGVDSYSGYSVGLRTLDNSLFIGRADFAWDEYQRLAIPGNIATNHFYHLTVIAVGCAIAARVDLPSGTNVTSGVSLQSCHHSGQIGLKSYQSPAAWRNFRVLPATQDDLKRLMNGKPFASARLGNLHFYDPRVDDEAAIEREAISRRVDVRTTDISELMLAAGPTNSQYASVHGVVRLVKPVTYVEDSTGSIVITSHDQPALAIGDEVVISGNVSRQSGQLELRNGHAQVLWSDTPAPPLVVTADAAATGSLDGRLALIAGTLSEMTKRADGSTILKLTAGGEAFQAIVAPAIFLRLPVIRPLSEVQLTGVVTSDSKFAENGAFALLLIPSEDAIRVIHEAPWWTPRRMIVLLIGGALTVAALLILYHKLKERYLLQTMREREILAHDLHDTVSQSLAGIGLQLSSAVSYLSPNDIARTQIDRARVMVSQSHQELRRSVTTLRHQITAIGDLAHALELSADRMIADAGIQLACTVRGVARRLPIPIADCFFRVGQEAISNAVQHSQATIISISVTCNRRSLSMRISDNGSGFNSDISSIGHGIFGMKRRAEMIGARFNIIRESHGTTIFIEKDLLHSGWLFEKFSGVNSLDVDD